MKKINGITFLLPTYNEESRINRVLEYYTKFSKVLIIDNYSTDNTCDIASSYDTEIFLFKNSGTIQTKEWFLFATELCKTDYFVLLSTSEFIPEPLIYKFETIAISKEFDMVSNVVDTYTCGEKIPLYGGRWGFLNRKIQRFFNKHEINYNEIKIHAPFVINNPNKVLYLGSSSKYIISHIRDSDVYSLTMKHLAYAKVESDTILLSGNNFGLCRFLKLILKEFIRLLQVPLTSWNFVTFREIWARIVMHSFIYYFFLEKKYNKDISYSRKMSDKLWINLSDNLFDDE